MDAAIRDELEQLRRAGGGILKAEAVVAFAADPATALHGEFTWDDAEAARQHRLEQARGLIRVHVTVIGEDAPPVRMYVSLGSDRREPGGGYRAMREVLADDERRAELLAQSLAELQSWERKYRTLAELAPVFEAAEALRRARARPARAGRPAPVPA